MNGQNITYYIRKACISHSQSKIRDVPAMRQYVSNHHMSRFHQFSTTGSDDAGQAWNWVPPRKVQASTRTDDHIIPVIERTFLSTTEIRTALEAQGAENVVVIRLKKALDTTTHMIIATGKSTRHLRKMSDSIVKALKSRKLTKAVGFGGAEGAKNDDWVAIDCYNVGVHLLLEHTRKSLDIEGHLMNENKPTIPYLPSDEKAYDKAFEELLEKYPVPADYNPAAEDYSTSSSQTSSSSQGTPLKIPKNITKL